MGTEYARYVLDTVSQSHKGLGRCILLVAAALSAQRCVLLVSPSGTGKSTTSKAIQQILGNTLFVGSSTMVGLKYYEEEMKDFYGAVIVDDLGGVDNEYARMSTIVTFAQLVETGVASKHSGRVDLELNGFRGSCLINVQPVLLKTMISAVQWEGNIADKVLRYYHYYWPVSLTDQEVPYLGRAVTADYAGVKVGLVSADVQYDLQVSAHSQWGLARSRVHITALLRGLASLCGDFEATNEHAKLLAMLLRPMRSERYLIVKPDFEGKKMFDSSLCYMMGCWATFGAWGVQDLSDFFHLSRASVIRILAKQDDVLRPLPGNPRRYMPSDKPSPRLGGMSMVSVLSDLGITLGGV